MQIKKNVKNNSKIKKDIYKTKRCVLDNYRTLTLVIAIMSLCHAQM